MRTLVALILVFGINQLHGQDKIVVSDNLELTRISENVYLHVAYIDHPGYGRISGNGLLVKTDSGIVIIDTPWNNEQAEELDNWVQTELKQNVSAVIVGHSHDDCAGGLDYFNKRNVISYGLELTKEFCLRDSLAYPGVIFTDSLVLDIGGKKLECYFPGAGHTHDNIVVWIESESVLFGGCLVKNIYSKRLGYIREADVDEWPYSVERVHKKYGNAQIVVPGHGAIGDTSLLLHTINLLRANEN